MDRRTPPEGWPVWVSELKQDLRDHEGRDRDMFASVTARIEGVHEHVANLRLESASNAAALARIEQSVQRRARTEDRAALDGMAYVHKRSLKLWGAVATVIAGGGGALVHWLLS